MLSLEDSLEEMALILSPEGQGKTWAGRVVLSLVRVKWVEGDNLQQGLGVLSGNHKGASLAFVPQSVLSTICYLPPVKPLCLIRRQHLVREPLGPFRALHLPTDPASFLLLKSIFLFLSLLFPMSASLYPPVSPIPILFSIPTSQCGQGPVREDRGGSGPEAVSGTPHLL